MCGEEVTVATTSVFSPFNFHVLLKSSARLFFKNFFFFPSFKTELAKLKYLCLSFSP